MQPTVTVVIPTYKRIDYLLNAIASVRQQIYAQFECLIVNDYPPDGSILKDKIAQLNDNRLQLINHDRSLGGNAARNTAIKAAQGEIIAFLDDDDYWLPPKLQRHLAVHHSNPQTGLVLSGLIKRWDKGIIPDKTSYGILPEEGVVVAMAQGKFCPVTTSSVTVRRECFTHCGLFDVNLTSFQDWDMWYRLAHQYQFECIQEPLIVFRQHLGDRTSQTKARRLQGLEQLIAKWHDDLADAQQFKTFFIKDTYANSVYNSILRAHKKEALQDWYKLLTLTNSYLDLPLLSKLMVMWLINPQNYGRLTRTSKL